MNRKLISQFLDNMLEGNYKGAETNAKTIVEQKLEKRFTNTYKNFLANKGNK